jgi:predicted ester cyclase
MTQLATAEQSNSYQTIEDQNKAVFRRYIDELWNAGKVEIIDEIMHDDLFCHQPSFQGDTRKVDMTGIIEAFHKAFPAGGFTFVIEEMIAEGDKVAVWLSFIGKQENEFCGVPSSGKTLSFNVLGYYRFLGSKIIEVRKNNVGSNHDFISAMGIHEQLGETKGVSDR